MADRQSGPRYVVPTPSTVRTLGILNIVFGVILLSYGSLSMIGAIFNTFAREPYNNVLQAVEIKSEIDYNEKLEKLRELEADAEFDSVRTLYSEQIARLENRGPQPNFMAEMSTMGFNMDEVLWWSWLDATTTVFVNLLMIFSGFGLLQFAEWGRKLGVQVAIAKISRLALVYGYWVIGVVPVMSRTVAESLERSMGPPGAGGPPFDMTSMYLIMYTVMGIGAALVGSIYPGLAWFFLSKPGVRAACIAEKATGETTPKDEFQ